MLALRLNTANSRPISINSGKIVNSNFQKFIDINSQLIVLIRIEMLSEVVIA